MGRASRFFRSAGRSRRTWPPREGRRRPDGWTRPCAAYEQAIASSPESAFLFRDLADIEAKQGKTDQAMQHYRTSIQLDPADVSSRVHVAEMLEARGDVEGAMAMYTEAYGLDPNPDIRRRLAALEARAAYLRLPAEYRALGDQPAITRGDLAALIGIRLEALLATAPPQAVLVTDTRNHWAAPWIMDGGARGRDGRVRQSHVPAAHRRAAERPGAGGEPRAENHRRAAARAAERLAGPAGQR